MKKSRVIILLVSICTLVGVLAVPAFAVDTKALINLFTSNPSAAVDQFLNLAVDNPETAASVLAGGKMNQLIKIALANPETAASFATAKADRFLKVARTDPKGVDLVLSAGVDQFLGLVVDNPETTNLALVAVMDQLLGLAATNPKITALFLAEFAVQAPYLENTILLTCLDLMEIDPSVAALAIATIKDRVPDMGRRIEKAAIACGLEKKCLETASPVRLSQLKK